MKKLLAVSISLFPLLAFANPFTLGETEVLSDHGFVFDYGTPLGLTLNSIQGNTTYTNVNGAGASTIYELGAAPNINYNRIWFNGGIQTMGEIGGTNGYVLYIPGAPTTAFTLDGFGQTILGTNAYFHGKTEFYNGADFVGGGITNGVPYDSGFGFFGVINAPIVTGGNITITNANGAGGSTVVEVSGINNYNYLYYHDGVLGLELQVSSLGFTIGFGGVPVNNIIFSPLGVTAINSNLNLGNGSIATGGGNTNNILGFFGNGTGITNEPLSGINPNSLVTGNIVSNSVSGGVATLVLVPSPTGGVGGSSIYNPSQFDTNASSQVEIKSGALTTNAVHISSTNANTWVFTNAWETNILGGLANTNYYQGWTQLVFATVTSNIFSGYTNTQGLTGQTNNGMNLYGTYTNNGNYVYTGTATNYGTIYDFENVFLGPTNTFALQSGAVISNAFFEGVITNKGLTSISNNVWGTPGSVFLSITNTSGRVGLWTVHIVGTGGVGTGFGCYETTTNWDGTIATNISYGEPGLTGLTVGGSNSFSFLVSSNSACAITVTAGTVVCGSPATAKWE